MDEQTQIEQLKKEIPDFLEGCKALGVQFCCSFLFEEEDGTHNITSNLGIHDDHHFLDMMFAMHKSWWKANHQKPEKDSLL